MLARALRAAADVGAAPTGELVRLRDDLACEFSPGALAGKPADAGRLRELFSTLGFSGNARGAGNTGP